MDLGHAGARVVVTGAGANIGDIDADQSERVAGELQALGAKDAAALAIDLTAEGAGHAVTDRVARRWGGIDVLVNNAGWSKPGWFAEQTDSCGTARST